MFDRRVDYNGLVPYKQYFAGIWVGMPNCASYVLHTHDVTDDVTRSISMSNIKIAISFIVERGNKYCHNLWPTGHPSYTLKFRFRFEISSVVENRNCFLN